MSDGRSPAGWAATAAQPGYSVMAAPVAAAGRARAAVVAALAVASSVMAVLAVPAA